tara:strand:+ start:6518 stop:7963 length:1446 start_codon:yes stop_codon:yes gene_type:complete
MGSPFSDNREHTVASLKLPPHSIEAEQSVLGGVLHNPEAWDTLHGFLQPDHFYRKEHQIMWLALRQVDEKNIPIDALTLVEELDGMSQLEAMGGINYIQVLMDGSAGAANIMHYAGIIRDRHTLRKLITAANSISETAYNPEGRPVDDIVNEAQALTMNVNPGTDTSTDLVLASDATKTMLEWMDERSKRKGLIGIATQIHDLDAKMSGLIKKDLIVIGGRPSMGKTTLAMNMAEESAKQGNLTLFFSLEMPIEALMLRMFANQANVPIMKMREGQLGESQWDSLTKSIGKLKDMPLYIDETPAMSPSMIRTRTRRLQRKTGQKVGLIVVDYIQLMSADTRVEKREGEISEITRKLKTMAKEFDCPIVALSQLNRSLENRPKDQRRPRMSDLRESGAIEQDADIIIFVYRDEVYNEDMSNFKGTVELIMAKHRNGPLAHIYAADQLEYMRIGNLARTHEMEYGQAAMAPSSEGLSYDKSKT